MEAIHSCFVATLLNGMMHSHKLINTHRRQRTKEMWHFTTATLAAAE